MLAVMDSGHIDSKKDADTETVLLAVTMTPGSINDLNVVRTILLLFAGLCLIVGIIFWLIGAGPVLPFMGIEVVLLYAAYRFGLNRTRISEKIALTERALTIQRTDRKGRRQSLSFEPYWLALKTIEEPGRLAKLMLTCKGQKTELGAFLAPSERLELSRLLETSLKRLNPI